MEFWKDPKMEEMLADIIDIFTKVEGVELVRLSGLTARAKRITGFNDLSESAIDNILHKIRDNGIITWEYEMKCPHCGEISYQITERDANKPKLCDSCGTIYKLTETVTMER